MKIQYIPRYTYADYFLWKGDWELINGYPFAMPALRTMPHQRVVTDFLCEVGNQLHEIKLECQVISNLDWIIDDQNVVRPDVMIFDGKIPEAYLQHPPIWVAEILSPSTAFRDQIVKKELYAEQGVKYYLIADTDKKIVAIYELINGEYQIKPDSRFDLTDHCSIQLDIEAIMNT